MDEEQPSGDSPEPPATSHQPLLAAVSLPLSR